MLDRLPPAVPGAWTRRCLSCCMQGTRGPTFRLGLGDSTKPPASREGLISPMDERYDAFFVDL